jgi:hypothetical protein
MVPALRHQDLSERVGVAIMRDQFLGRLAVAFALATILTVLAATNAAAVPAFAIQTGEPCQACHVGGFGPELTPLGREFKLQGYTLRTNTFNLPFSVAVTASYLNTMKSQNPPPAGFAGNDNLALDQVNFFFAGGFGQHLGAFVQATYDGISKAWTWDNLDVRAVDTFKVKDTDVTVGASFNNSPTVQDAWNTLPAWGYPYTSSELAPTPATSPLLSGALAQTTVGITGYAWINSEFYIEGGAYWSPSASLLTHLGVDPTDPGDIRGAAPYGRLAFQHDLGGGAVEIGLFGLQAEIYPGLDQTTGFADRYTDLGVDGSYQYSFASTDVVSLNGRYLHEDQSLQATCALDGAGAGCAANTVDDVRIDASYYWRDKIGLTVSGFDTTGSSNPVLYAGNRTLRPDSSGVMVQLDATPWGDGKSPFGKRFNTRVGLQYTDYTEFNGAASNWDGMGSNARDNNTLRVFVWAAY